VVERDCRLWCVQLPSRNLALERTGLRQHLFFADDVRTALESGLSERRPSNVIRTSFG
jgi:hypothetical protein